MTSYKRLGPYAREEISRGLAQEKSMRSIAALVGCNVSTICRELRRFSKRTVYRAHKAQKHANLNARGRRFGKRKLVRNTRLLKVVKEKLDLFWSPEQIAVYLKDHYKDCNMHISGESIYTYIYVYLRRNLRHEFSTQLRRQHKKRRVRGRSARGQTSNLEDMTLIDERPKEVDGRLVPGHWEGDIIIGGALTQTALGTLVERTTRYTILVPLKNKTSEEVRKAFAREIKTLPQSLRRSLTYDQGREMAQHKLFTKQTKMKVYFAHPQSPWERGTNENTNGLIRQYFPKGIDFRKVPRSKIKQAQRSLNGRPRKTLGFKTPAEAMKSLLH